MMQDHSKNFVTLFDFLNVMFIRESRFGTLTQFFQNNILWNLGHSGSFNICANWMKFSEF